MANIRAFRSANCLIQKDLSEFLGVSITFISAVERGDSKLPAEQLAKLMGNPYGWDTTALTEECREATYKFDIHDNHGSMPNGCEFNGKVENNFGYSEEEVERRVNEKTAVMQADMRTLETEIAGLKEQLAFVKSQLASEKETKDRFLKIIENMK